MALIGLHAAIYSAWLAAQLLLAVAGLFGLIVFAAGMVATRSKEISPDPNRVPPFPSS